MAAVSPTEWEILRYDEFSSHILPSSPPEGESHQHAVSLPGSIKRSQNSADIESPAQQKKSLNRFLKSEQSIRKSGATNLRLLIISDVPLFLQIKDLLLRLKEVQGAQSEINGSFSNANNIWMVKPAAMSRGRGICAFTDLPKVLQLTKTIFLYGGVTILILSRQRTVWPLRVGRLIIERIVLSSMDSTS